MKAAAVPLLASLALPAYAVPYDLPDDGNWYSLLSADGEETLCRLDLPDCDVDPGEYILKNWTGGATVVVTVTEEEACVRDGYEFPADGNWYSLLDAESGDSLCRIDRQPCSIVSGDYVLKNWSGGTEREVSLAHGDSCGIDAPDDLS